MSVWNKTDPTGSEKTKYGDDRLRGAKEALQDAFQKHCHFPVDVDDPELHYKGEEGESSERPSAGSSGIYFDTEKNELQVDNGSTWTTVGLSFDTGTTSYFYQSVAPVGWTIETGHTDRMLLTSTSSAGDDGGSYGGSVQRTNDGNHRHDVCVFTNTGGNVGITFYETWTSAGMNISRNTGLWHLDIVAASIFGKGSSSFSSISDGQKGYSSYTSNTHTHNVSHDESDHMIAKGLICVKA